MVRSSPCIIPSLAPKKSKQATEFFSKEAGIETDIKLLFILAYGNVRSEYQTRQTVVVEQKN